VVLTPHDSFAGDDRVQLEVPAQPALRVTVYSEQPDLLRPVLAANTRLAAVYRKPGQYRSDDQGLVIIDRFIPAQRPRADSIWIDPPAQGSPVPVRTRATNVTFNRWHSSEQLAQGLHMKDFRLDSVSIFEPGADDIRVGSVAAGPVILARTASPKIVVIGFHPALSPMRYELATPLLFANLMRWTSPEIFRRWELAGGSIGTVKLLLDDDTAPSSVKITQDNGSAVPFTMRDRALNFFAGKPGVVRVVAGDREYLYSLTLPQLWDTKWQEPPDIRHGVPRVSVAGGGPGDYWPWFAIAGGAVMLAEWLIYGRFRRTRRLALGTLLFRRKAASSGVRR
jgi:hypothetical protein